MIILQVAAVFVTPCYADPLFAYVRQRYGLNSPDFMGYAQGSLSNNP